MTVENTSAVKEGPSDLLSRSPLRELLHKYRGEDKSPRDQGRYFENLARIFLEKDPVQANQYEWVKTYSDWAKDFDLDGRDLGIDLVAKLRDEDGYAAVQCKFLDAKHIPREELTNFIAASSKPEFKRRVMIDTTSHAWSDNDNNLLRGQEPPVLRIGLNTLEESAIDWSIYLKKEKVEIRPKKVLHPYQKEAVNNVCAGFEKGATRGKMIMACGTGKTLTSLRIAERLAGKQNTVLYLVPSLSLMSQTVREWTVDVDKAIGLRSFAVCSDSQVGKRRSSDDDLGDVDVLDLEFPASTNSDYLYYGVTGSTTDKMTVVFGTYQSIDVITRAQSRDGFPDFDLVICDEAHRTTGVTFENEEESSFVKIHHDRFVRASKRLYMTATPRIYAEAARTRAREENVVLASMDDEEIYGNVFHHIGFAEAVKLEALADYRVIVLAVNEDEVGTALQKRLMDPETKELRLDNYTKMIGCYRALAKQDKDFIERKDTKPMRRAVAFCRSIKTSEAIRDDFNAVIDEYLASEKVDKQIRTAPRLKCGVSHVDGSFGAKERNKELDWLRFPPKGECHILSNARCLTEGVDVPDLDAVLFMHPRRSQVDVVQAVGRVMRRFPGKELGYVILPVGIPAGIEPHDALNNNEKYRVVWQVLNALRSHDERLNAVINKMGLGQHDASGKIVIGGDVTRYSAELAAITNRVEDFGRKKPDDKDPDIGEAGRGDSDGDEGTSKLQESKDKQASLDLDEFSKAVIAKMVKKCGTRTYWSDWTANIAKIAEQHMQQITDIVEQEGTPARKAFDNFLLEIQISLNSTIQKTAAIEMIAQHVITAPIFDGLFEEYEFVDRNPVSQALNKVLEALGDENITMGHPDLISLYAQVRLDSEGITTPEVRRDLIKRLYEEFFQGAFARTTQRLGVVYTPTEIVDFIIHSANEVLRDEFGKTLGSKGVNIIDPFTGTGTFITRLLESGIIKKSEMTRKFKSEIAANEIMLLAYYIAAVNIESTYQSIMGGDFVPFEGICFADSFAMFKEKSEEGKKSEKKKGKAKKTSAKKPDMFLSENEKRRHAQSERDITVVIGNPPWSVGQRSRDENNPNPDYPLLDKSIEETYGENATATLLRNLYDSYIRAIHFASKRIEYEGLVALVAPNAWLERSFADRMRLAMAKEFDAIWIFDLRGDIRKNRLSNGTAGEGQNAFGNKTQNGVCISLLIKKSNKERKQAKIYYCDIGDDLTTEKKLNAIRHAKSLKGLNWHMIDPTDEGDWINQRAPRFQTFIELGNNEARRTKVKNPETIFKDYSGGIVTARDTWVYNFNKEKIENTMLRMINAYNKQCDLFAEAIDKNPDIDINQVLDFDSPYISWSNTLIEKSARNKKGEFDPNKMCSSLYRPFDMKHLYLDKTFIDRPGRFSSYFPNPQSENFLICVTGRGTRGEFSCLMTNSSIDFQFLSNTQAFPRWVYKDGEKQDNITDFALDDFRKHYGDNTITKDDIFYFVYGILHAPDYRKQFKNDLNRDLPRIPKPDNFRDFSRKGKKLAKLHLNWKLDGNEGNITKLNVFYKDDLQPTFRESISEGYYNVSQMEIKERKAGKFITYNSFISIGPIPEEAFKYTICNRVPLKWITDQYKHRTTLDSGVSSDPNDWIKEQGKKDALITLIERVCHLSIQTHKIIQTLPKSVPEEENE